MLDTMPYADLLAIYNAVSEKPVTRFDNRANGVRRTEALLEARGLTLADAARLADVVLPHLDAVLEEAPPDSATQPPAEADFPAQTPDERANPNPAGAEAGHDAERNEDDRSTTIHVDASLSAAVNAFVRELTKPVRPAYIAAFLRRLAATGAVPGRTTTKREGGMTPSQRKVVDLCSRPGGATGKELAEGCGWPSIAARATCQKLADRFGYDLHESPKTNGRGISFRMIVKATVEKQA